MDLEFISGMMDQNIKDNLLKINFNDMFNYKGIFTWASG